MPSHARFCKNNGRCRAAFLKASQRQGERPIADEEARRLGELLMRSDALSNTRAILEDLPEEAFGHAILWEIVAALKRVSDEASAEVGRYKGKLGVRAPEDAAG